MLHDLKFALRAACKAPILTLVVVGSLAIGIGANTIIFSWLQALVLEPIPAVQRSASLITVEAKSASGGFPGLAWTEYRELKEQVTAFQSLLATRAVPLYVGEPGQEERLSGMLVSENYFAALNLRPAAGRFFQPSDFTPASSAPAAVISHDYWLNQFQGAPDVIGRPVRVNGLSLTILGVAPERFQGTAAGLYYDIWIPAQVAPTIFPGSRELEARESRGYIVLGRLKPGVTPAQANEEVKNYMQRLAADYPATNGPLTGFAAEFWRAPRGAQSMFGGALAALQGMMFLVLLLVCANSANLLLARAATRRQEIGVRMAMGAGRWQIVRQLTIEGLVLAAFAVAGGLFFAAQGIDAFRALPVMGSIPWRVPATLDGLGIAVSVALATVCTLVFSLVPALQLSRLDVRAALHTSSSGGVPGRRWLRGLLIGSEVGLAFCVLVIAATFVKALNDESSGSAGFRTERLTLAAYDLSGRGYTPAAAAKFTGDLLRGLQELPGVESAAIAAAVPLDLHGLGSLPITIPGRERRSAAPDTALSFAVTPGYFTTLGLAFLEGRDFADLADTTKGLQTVVNEEFARRYFDGASPLGRAIVVRDRYYEVVGIVKNAKYNSLTESPQPAFYTVFRDRMRGEIHLRTTASNANALDAVRGALGRIDARIVPYDIRTFSEHVEKNLYLRRVPANLFSLLGPFALLLAVIGIYAVVAHAVVQRTAEIGLRLAIGASPDRVIRELAIRHLRPVVIGLGVSWLAVFLVANRFAGARGPGLDLQTVVALGLIAVAALACWWPARRAAQVDPLVALRAE